jgi:hypothetical protein
VEFAAKKRIEGDKALMEALIAMGSEQRHQLSNDANDILDALREARAHIRKANERN